MSLRTRIAVALGLAAGLGAWRAYERVRPWKVGASPRERVAREVDEVLSLTDSPVKLRPDEAREQHGPVDGADLVDWHGDAAA